jgi:hypothetical protein
MLDAAKSMALTGPALLSRSGKKEETRIAQRRCRFR